MSDEEIELEDEALALAAGGVRIPNASQPYNPPTPQGPVATLPVDPSTLISNFSDHHIVSA